MAKILLNDFEHLNTTTQSIYELGEFNVLIVLKDGTNLTSWDYVENKEDVVFISEDLFGETLLEGRYKNFVNLKAVVTIGVGNIVSTKDMFSGCVSLEEISSLDTWDVSLVDDVSNMFKGCSSLEDLSALANWNTSSIIDMSCMFMGCSSLEDLSPLANWNVSHVDDMHYLFADCVNLKNISALGNWDVRNVRDLACIFEFCTSLEDISALGNWKLLNAFNITALFRSCVNIRDISALSKWDLNAMTNNKSLLSIFAYCASIKNISALKNWDLSNINRISGLFEGCSSIKNLSDLKGWDVSNVLSFDYLFKNCTSLSNVSALANWDVSNATSFKSMFKHCRELEDISPLGGWNVSQVRTMEGMFKRCDSISDAAVLYGWKLHDNVKLDFIFDDCESLEKYPYWFELAILTNENFDEESKDKVIAKLDVDFFKANDLNGLKEIDQFFVVDKTSDESLLAYFVERSNFNNIQRVALDKISDEDILTDIAIHDHNYEIVAPENAQNLLDCKFFFYNRENALRKVKNKVLLIKIAKESQYIPDNIEYIAQYVDTEEAWIDIVINAKSSDVKLFALDKIKAQNSFQRIVDESADESVKAIAMEKITDE